MEWNKFFRQGQQVGSPRNSWGRMLTFSEPRGKQEYVSKWATMAHRYEYSNRCFTWNRSALYWRPNKLSRFTISRLLSTPQILAATINIPLIMLYRRSICLCNSFNNLLPAKIEAWFISMALDHNTKTPPQQYGMRHNLGTCSFIVYYYHYPLCTKLRRKSDIKFLRYSTL